MNIIETPKDIQEYAYADGMGEIVFIGELRDGTQVFQEKPCVGEDGEILATGFPHLLLHQKDGEFSQVCGIESFDVMHKIITPEND